MSIYKQAGSGVWWMSFYDAGGKRKRLSTGTRNKEKAEAVEASVRAAMRGNIERDKLFASIDALMGWESGSTGIPVSELWPTYLLTKPRAGADTMARRRRLCEKLVAWTEQYHPTAHRLHNFTPQMALGFCDWLLETSGGIGKTQNGRIGHLSAVFSAVVIRANMQSNPFQFVGRADESDSTSGRAFSDAEVKALLKVCRKAEKNWYEASLISLYSGLRLIDIACLRWDSIEPDYIDITPSKTKRHGIRVRVPLHPKVRAALDPMRRADGPSPALRTGPVFEWLHHHYRNNKGSGYPELIRKAKIDPKGAKLSFHCWRHTFRTRLAAAEVPQEVAMKLGGWTNESTAEIYNHDFSQLQAAINKMA